MTSVFFLILPFLMNPVPLPIIGFYDPPFETTPTANEVQINMAS